MCKVRNIAIVVAAVISFVFSESFASFDKINDNTSKLFSQMLEAGDTAIFLTPVGSTDLGFRSADRDASFDSILYVGYTDPNETLTVADTSCYFGCDILVLQSGVLIVRNSSVRVYGNLIATQNGKIVIDSSEVRLVSAYEWQFSLASLDSAEIRIIGSEFDYGGYPGYTFIKDNSSLYVENSNYTGTTALYSQNARVNYINVTGGGEYSARDSSVVHFSNVEYAVIHIQIPESTLVDMDFATDTFEFVEHWEVTPSSPFVSGTGYTFIIDSTYCTFNPSCASFSELTVENSQCDILVRFTRDVCDTISGLVNRTHYGDWFAPISDRTVHLVNTTVTCWHMQMFASSNITIENSIVGEFICFDSSEAYLSNSIHDGTGGPLTAAGHSQVYVSNTDVRPTTVKVRNSGILALSFCTVWRDFVVADSGLAVLLGTLTLNPIRVFDEGAAVVAGIRSPATAAVGDSVAIIGDAYIERTPTSVFDFDAYRLYYVSYPIDTIINIDSLEWVPITGWISHQVRDDTLAVWNTSGLEAGRYFLKLDWRESSTGSVVYTFYRVSLRESASVKDVGVEPEGIWVAAYPNPFNSVVRISVGRELMHSCVEIFDIAGRRVARFSESADAASGACEYIWRPNEPLGSGVYIVRVRMDGGKQLVKRIVLIK